MAAFDPAVICENTGLVQDVLDAIYTEYVRVSGVPVYRLDER